MVLFSTIMFSPPLSVQAQTPTTPTPAPTGDQQLPPIEGKINPPAHPKMDSTLNRIVGNVAAGQSAVQSATSAPLHRAEAVLVTFYVIDGQHADALLDYLESNGASVRNIGVDYLEAYVPVSLLVSASETPGVIRVQTIIPPQPAQQRAISEGVAAHGANVWHEAGITGQGVKIGVVDIGFEAFSSLMGTTLPSTVQVRCYTDVGVPSSVQADCENGSAHGTAVTEALFDIAPGATYFIANPWSAGDLKATVEWMIANNVDVINQSVGWIWDGPGDGTSPYSVSPLRTVDMAVESGVTWVNSAGNSADRTWFGSFSNKNDSDYWHSFEGEDECNTVELEAGERIRVQLRWDSRWGGATRDLDIYIYLLPFGGGADDALALSENEQSGGIDHAPYEYFSFTPDTDGNYCLAIRHYGGSQPSWIQLQIWGGDTLEYHTSNGSIVNPSESANAGLLAVGAAGWDNPDVVRPFSSRGPAPDGRIKPDVVGADGTYSDAYGERWVGTSLASPHVAGLAALVQQRFPEHTPDQVAGYIKQQAEPRGPVPNNTWGYGFARLLAADAVEPEPSPTPEPTASCWTEVEGDAIFYGAWDENCLSDKPAEDGGDRYAQFYTFGLTETANIIITLESAEDAMLYLLEGDGKDGRVLEQNDDADNAAGLNLATDSRIAMELQPGDYTIEATTYAATTSGDFTLTVTLGVTVEPPPPPPTPTPTPPPAADTGYTFISSGADHVCALHSDGSVACWGENDQGQATPPNGTYIAISSGQSHTCALRSDGAVVCWGNMVVNP